MFGVHRRGFSTDGDGVSKGMCPTILFDYRLILFYHYVLLNFIRYNRSSNEGYEPGWLI